VKISSKTADSVDASLMQCPETKSLLQMANFDNFSLLKLLDQIGTSIALGEAGDLNAAHEFRKKNSGQK
jgi:hypothetical protein